MNQARKIVHYPDKHSVPYTGNGIGIAILDTGIFLHEDFTSHTQRKIRFKDFVHQRKMPYDDHGHGTHVAGIAVGNGYRSNGLYQGIAPKADLIICKILDAYGNGSIRHILKAIDWVIQHKEKDNIRILNISVGSENVEANETNSTLVQSVNTAWDEGLIVIVAAGNNGPKNMSVTSPGISRKVITVGSSDDYKTVHLHGSPIIHYSGRGPTRELVLKPDIVAPGSNICSCSPYYDKKTNPYTIRSGTSMATPIVSGAVALLLEKNPQLTNDQVKKLLQKTATDLFVSKYHQGYGQLNIQKLLSYALSQ